MLPPPMTMASRTSSSLTSLISLAIASQVSGEMPCGRLPSNDSPLNFNITRRYFGVGAEALLMRFLRSGGRLRRLLAELPTDEPADDDVFPQLRDLRGEVVLDYDFVVLHERLFEETDGGI